MGIFSFLDFNNMPSNIEYFLEWARENHCIGTFGLSTTEVLDENHANNEATLVTKMAERWRKTTDRSPSDVTTIEAYFLMCREITYDE